jgi:hypothetical protein
MSDMAVSSLLLHGHVLRPKFELTTQVIYRELRDFLSLHAHYKAANFGTSVPGVRSSRHVDIPEFPKMSELRSSCQCYKMPGQADPQVFHT